MNNSTVRVQLAMGYRIPRPRDCPAQIYSLMLRCWSQVDVKRPKFSELATAISAELIGVAAAASTSVAVESSEVVPQNYSRSQSVVAPSSEYDTIMAPIVDVTDDPLPAVPAQNTILKRYGAHSCDEPPTVLPVPDRTATRNHSYETKVINDKGALKTEALPVISNTTTYYDADDVTVIRRHMSDRVKELKDCALGKSEIESATYAEVTDA